MRNERKIGSQSKDTKPAAAKWAALPRNSESLMKRSPWKEGEQANLLQGCVGVGVDVSSEIRAEGSPGFW